MDKWDACGGEFDLYELKGKPCYAGLDLAATTDLTALSLVFPRDDGYDVVMRFWIPGDTAKDKERRDRVDYSLWSRQGFIKLTEGNVIDYGYVRQELRELAEVFDIKEIAFDRRSFDISMSKASSSLVFRSKNWAARYLTPCSSRFFGISNIYVKGV